MRYDDSETNEDEFSEQEIDEDKSESDENENSDSLEEFKPRKQFPVNIDINIDETPSEEQSSDSENTEENTNEEEGGEFESSDFVPSSRFNSGKILNPFLEQESIEPVRDLETDLQDVRTNTQRNQQEIQNAPQYSSSSGDYTGKSYYEQPEDDTYPRPVRPMQTGFSETIHPNLPFDDVSRAKLLGGNEAIGWGVGDDSGYPKEDQKYSFKSEPAKKRRNDW